MSMDTYHLIRFVLAALASGAVAYFVNYGPKTPLKLVVLIFFGQIFHFALTAYQESFTLSRLEPGMDYLIYTGVLMIAYIVSHVLNRRYHLLARLE